MGKSARKPVKRRLPQQVHVCDSCGAKLPKWEKVWCRPDYSQIVCDSCKETIINNISKSPFFDEDEIERFFREMPLCNLQFI